MGQLDNIVVVDIVKGQAGVTRPGFGVPFLLSYTANFPELYKKYTTINQVAADFSLTSVEYLRAKALFDNTTRDNNETRMLSPEEIYIGRLPSNARITVLKNEDGNYTVNINSTEFTFAATSNTKADIAAGLVALINAGGEPVTAEYTATKEYFDLYADVANTDFTVEVADTQKLQTSIPQQVSTLTFDADLVALNTIDMNVVHNEVTWAMPQVTFTSDHQTTMGLIATALETNDYIESATVSLTPFREIEIVTIDNREISLTGITVSLGASQANGTWAEDFGFKNGDAKTYLDNLSFQDYYFVLYARDFYDNAEIIDLSDFLENWEYKKAFFFNTNDVRLTTSSSANIAVDIVQKMIDRGKTKEDVVRTIGYYTKQLDNYVADGLVGANGPKSPGSLTWAYQKSKLAIYDDYTNEETKTDFLRDNNMNYYTRIAGLDVAAPSDVGGKVIGGEYFDITRGSDWLQANMELDIFEIFALTDKIPYTNKGVKVLVNAVYNRMIEGQKIGFLSDDETVLVTAPDVNDLTAAQRQSRSFGTIVATGRFAGAIQKALIQINLSF
jgi:hypothetical protein